MKKIIISTSQHDVHIKERSQRTEDSRETIHICLFLAVKIFFYILVFKLALKQ